MKRGILGVAVVIIECLGMEERLIMCKLGHSVGKVVTIGATTPSGKFDPKVRSMEVVLGGGNKGMKETKFSAMPSNLRDFRFGNKSSLNTRH